jgi:hypothetical protein
MKRCSTPAMSSCGEVRRRKKERKKRKKEREDYWVPSFPSVLPSASNEYFT